jgi:ankyrin repeat protein
MPILLDFHPFEQKHSAIQRYILRALEELSHNHSDRSNIIKLYLFFIHFCGFGNAVAQNLGLALKYLQEACLGYFQSMTKKDEEHRMNALAMVVAGTPLEAIPMNDMSAFIVQIEGVSEAKKGNLPDLRGYEQGVTQNAESGSPIAREILKTHFRGIFDRLQSPTHPLRSVDKIDEDHVLELELPMDRLREFEQMVASHPEIPWKRHFKDIPGLDGLSHHGDTYLHLAAQHGYTAVVCELLANFPDTGFENLGNFRKETPLLQAAKAGHFAICQALLDAGADVRAESIYRETALHWACSFTAETDIKSFVGTLVDWGADLTAVAGQKSYGMMDTYRSYGTPLERAVARNNAQAVKVLLEVGKNQEKDLITTEAVHVAAKFHFAQCLELLLNACGRRLGSSRVKGMNLMGSAIFGLPVWQWMNWHGMVHEKAARDTIELLLKAGIDTRIVAIFTPNGESFPVQFSAVGAAAAVGSANMLTVLLKRGIPPDVEFDPEHVGFEYPPLYEAMSRGYRDAFLTLLAHGADVNMTRPMIGGDNYLHLCAYHHWDLFFARELLQRGADVNRGNPFYAAVLASNFELADVLLKHGADMQGRLPNIGMTLLGDLLTLVPEVSKEHLEYVLSKASSTENDGQSPFVVLKSMNVTALHMACTLDFKGDHQFHDLQTLAEDRRIIEFLLEKGPKEHLNAKTDEGHTALILAVTSGHLEAARLLLEAGVGEVKDWVQCFKLIVTKLSQAVPENIFSGGEKAKSTYRQRQADIAVLLSNYLPHGQVLSVNCYSTRLQEVREREGMGILPLRASWISAKKYYLDDFVRSNTTTQNRVSMPRLGKHPRMFQSYMEDVMVSLAGSLPAFWFMSRPQRATEKALAGVRRALWEILDVDWVVLVVTDGRFLSRSKRLMILQNSIQDMLSPAFVLKLKLAGTGKKFELLYKVTLKQDGDGQDSNEEHYYGELVTWIPPFEEGRTWEDLDKWEDFVGRLGLKEDMDMFAYMKKAKYEETDWAAEIGRVAHETVKTDSSDEEEEESGSDDSSDDQYHDDTSDSEDEQML